MNASRTSPEGPESPDAGRALPASTPVAQPSAEPTQDERVMSAVSHGLSFVEGGLIGPLVIYLLKKDESDFVAFHALQSLYFGVAFIAISLVTCGLAAVVLVWPYLIFEAIAAFKAYEGEWYELPFVGRYARGRHPGHAPVPASF